MSKENLSFSEAVRRALSRPPSKPLTVVLKEKPEHADFNAWFRREARRGEFREDIDTGEITVEEAQ